MVVKLDMSKAYDRVDWEFLRVMMLKMGFNDRWGAMMMKCISTVFYSLCLNGSLGPIFLP